MCVCVNSTHVPISEGALGGAHAYIICIYMCIYACAYSCVCVFAFEVNPSPHFFGALGRAHAYIIYNIYLHVCVCVCV